MPASLTYRQVKAFYLKYGCILISTLYSNCEDVLRYTCRCGNEHEVSYKTFSKRPPYKCPNCPDFKTFPKKFSLEDARKIFRDSGCQLLSPTYTSCMKPLQFLCSCGSKAICSISLTMFNTHGTNCKACRMDRLKATNQARYGVDFNIKRDGLKERMVAGIVNSATSKKPAWDIVVKDFADQQLQILQTFYVDQCSPIEYRCIICHNESAITYLHLKNGGQGCNSQHCVNAKRKKTCNERFGFDCPLQSPEIKEKARVTILAKYGVDFVTQNMDVQAKIAATNLARRGATCSLQSEVVQAKIRQNCFDKYGVDHHIVRPDVKEKIKKTMLEKYGVEHYSNTPEFKIKIIETNMDRLGVPHSMMSENVQKKSIETFRTKYGVDNASQVAEIQAKKMATSQARYNTDYPMQHPDVYERSQKMSKTLKTYTMPSGKDIVVQGFEPLALDNLLATYHEDDILNERKEMPEIWYSMEDGKYRTYICDFFVPKDNLIVEVKSTYTYLLEFKKNDVKRKACEYAGYNFKMMLFDDRRRLIS